MYQAIELPQPQRDEDMAVKWNVEAEYLAVSENLMETSLVTRDQVDKCIGSSKYRICHETLATESKCGCSPLIRMRVFKPHNEPYYMEIDIDPIEFKRLYDTLGKHHNSLKLESTFKDKTRRTVGLSRRRTLNDSRCKYTPQIICILTVLQKERASA